MRLTASAPSQLWSRSVLVAALAFVAACASTDDDVASVERAVVQDGTPQAAAVLTVANLQPYAVLNEAVGLDRRAATSIVDHRPFATFAALDVAPYVGPHAIDLLLAYAVSHGQVGPGGAPVVLGVEEGSRNARSILKMANHLSLALLDANSGVGLDHRAAEGIVAQRPLASLAALAAVPYVGQSAFERLLAYAVAHGMESMWPPPHDVGEAPMLIVPGIDIPSSRVDAARSYASRRSIEWLAWSGALDSVARQVAERADGVMANQPADGYIDLAELVSLEQPEFFNLLFAEEKARLPVLFQRLEVPTTPRVDLRFPELAALTVENRFVPPGGPPPPPLIRIATLAAERQPAASRAQLVFNSDTDASTISIADLDAVVDNPDAFTPQELDHFDAIRNEFQARATSNAVARIGVMTPGTTVETRTVGGLTVTRTVTIEHVENRTMDAFYGTYWTGYVHSNRNVTCTLGSTTAGMVLLVDETTGQERGLQLQPSALAEAPAGNYLLEQWQNGVRLGATHGQISTWGGAQQPQASLYLGDYLDTELETMDGQPLVRNVVSAGLGWGSRTFEAVYRFETSARPNPGADTYVLDWVASRPSALPAGRYRLTDASVGVITLDLYPSGAARASAGAVAGAPLQLAVSSWNKFLAGPLGIDNYSLRLYPTGQVQVYYGPYNVLLDRTLTALDRVQ